MKRIGEWRDLKTKIDYKDISVFVIWPSEIWRPARDRGLESIRDGCLGPRLSRVSHGIPGEFLSLE